MKRGIPPVYIDSDQRYNIINMSLYYIILMFLRIFNRFNTDPRPNQSIAISENLLECAECGSHISRDMTIERGWDLSFCSCYCRNRFRHYNNTG